MLNYHSIFLEQIKKSCGASFVGFEREKDSYSIKVIKNKETSLFPMVGSPEFATPQGYNEVLKTITEYYATL
jgi:hypothetical protein